MLSYFYVILTYIPASQNDNFSVRNWIQLSTLETDSGLPSVWFSWLRLPHGPSWLLEYSCHGHRREEKKEELKGLPWNHQPFVLTFHWLPYFSWKTGKCSFIWAHCAEHRLACWVGHVHLLSQVSLLVSGTIKCFILGSHVTLKWCLTFKITFT